MVDESQSTGSVIPDDEGPGEPLEEADEGDEQPAESDDDAGADDDTAPDIDPDQVPL